MSSLIIYNGWNFISFNREGQINVSPTNAFSGWDYSSIPNNSSFELKSINSSGTGESTQYYHYGAYQQWATAAEGATLVLLQVTQAYLMNWTGNPTTLPLLGNLVNPTVYPITLFPGWNYIGYLPNTLLTPTNALNSLDYTDVPNNSSFELKSINSSGTGESTQYYHYDAYQQWATAAEGATLITMKENQGYLMNWTGGNKTFTYPGSPSVETVTRTFPPPESGVLFSTSFFSDASLIAQDTGLDPSANAYWAQQVSTATWNQIDNSGITVITVQTISNETFTKYLGAHTLEFTNWDFSANDPSGEGNVVGVGYDGKNTIKSYNDSADSSANWDLSATMMVGIPTNYAQNSSTNVLFPVAIQSSTEPNYNVINHTDNSNTSFIDLYAVLGKPNLVNVKNAYDENLTAIDVSYVNFRSVNSASIIYVGVGKGSLPFFNFYSDASGLVELYPPSGDVDTSLNRLLLVKNRPYTFKRIATDNDHPFIITNNAPGTQPTQGTITTNSINDNGHKLISDESTLIINSTFLLSSTLTWYCKNHSTSMNGTFDVI